MPLKSLILHIGPMKTGTSSFQKSLMKAKQQFSANSIWVPKLSLAGGHFSILREIVGPSSFDSEYPWFETKISISSVKKSMVKYNSETLILSSEGFVIDKVGDNVTALIHALNPERLKILLTLREPISWINSLQAENILTGIGPVSIESFTETKTHLHDWLEFFCDYSLGKWADGPHSTQLVIGVISDNNLMDMYQEMLGLKVSLPRVAIQRSRQESSRLRVLKALNQMELAGCNDVQILTQYERRNQIRYVESGYNNYTFLEKNTDQLDPRIAIETRKQFQKVFNRLKLRANQIVGNFDFFDTLIDNKDVEVLQDTTPEVQEVATKIFSLAFAQTVEKNSIMWSAIQQQNKVSPQVAFESITN
jgi:hypothetical protein